MNYPRRKEKDKETRIKMKCLGDIFVSHVAVIVLYASNSYMGDIFVSHVAVIVLYASNLFPKVKCHCD